MLIVKMSFALHNHMCYGECNNVTKQGVKQKNGVLMFSKLATAPNLNKASELLYYDISCMNTFGCFLWSALVVAVMPLICVKQKSHKEKLEKYFSTCGSERAIYCFAALSVIHESTSLLP